MNYDFSQLNDKEFERLSIDLLSSYLKTRIERFKPGKDEGVDGRFFVDEQSELIIQCKHYLKSGYSKLILILKNEEKVKVEKLKPKNYLFVTSLPLSRSNKREIKEIFHPYIQRGSNIFGNEDLNDLLSRFPDIEEKYFKLWISSTNILHRLINNAIKGRSKFEIERIERMSPLFVQTNTFFEAIEKIKKNNVLILSGEPGIGKTTLAENLCLFYVSRDYEFIDIEESLSEAEDIYTREKKQIFYFDDFLGSNYFEAIENKKDSHIMKFIDRIKYDKTKVFILTTRTNIFRSGISHSSLFYNQKIEQNEYLLTIRDLDAIDKAQILYNHIWHSKLQEIFIEELYKKKRYKQIIFHKNYNPRLIEFITDHDRISVDPESYWDFVVNTLENPKDIWDSCFKTQNNSYVRNLVILVVFNGSEISDKNLREGYSKLCQLENLGNSSHTEKDFNSMIRLATKSFLNRNEQNGVISYSLFNPSIADYILNEYITDSAKLINVYKSISSVKSLRHLVSLQIDFVKQIQTINTILEAVFTCSSECEENYDYLLYLADIFHEDEEKHPQIIQLLQRIVKNSPYFDEISLFFELMIDFKDKIIITEYQFLHSILEHKVLDQEELTKYTKFLDVYNITDSSIINWTNDIINEYMIEQVDRIKDDLNISKFIDYYADEDGIPEPDIDWDGMKEEIKESLKSSVSDFNLKKFKTIDLDISYLADDVNLEELTEQYFKSQEYDPEDYDHERERSDTDEENIDDIIDDIFEKT